MSVWRSVMTPPRTEVTCTLRSLLRKTFCVAASTKCTCIYFLANSPCHDCYLASEYCHNYRRSPIRRHPGGDRRREEGTGRRCWDRTTMLLLTSFPHVVVILHRPITSHMSLLLLLPLLSAAVASAAMVGHRQRGGLQHRSSRRHRQPWWAIPSASAVPSALSSSCRHRLVGRWLERESIGFQSSRVANCDICRGSSRDRSPC